MFDIKKRFNVKPQLIAILVFILGTIVSIYISWQTENQRVSLWKYNVAVSTGIRAGIIERNVSQVLSSTYPLAALVRKGHGTVSEFEKIAEELLPYYPGASGLALAPEGVVRQIVPLQGNEKAIGHDLFKDPKRDKEAFKARDSGDMTLAGPFELVQGGIAAAGRLPVYLTDDNDSEVFWGFVSVLLRFPQTLESADLQRLQNEGYDYQLWRTHPDTGKKHIIDGSTGANLKDPIEQGFHVPNGIWTLSVAPHHGWRDFGMFGFKMAVGLLISGILAALGYAMARVRQQQLELELRVEERTAELEYSEQALTRALENVAHSETHHRTLFSGNSVIMLLIDPENGNIIDANRAAVTFYGHSLPSLRKMNISDINPQSMEQLEEEIDLIQRGEKRYFNCQHRLANGESRDVRLSSGSITLNGKAVLLSSVQDVTAEKLLEAEKRKDEASMREALVVFNSSSQGIVTTDANAVIISVNPAFTAITGYSAEDAIGKNPSILSSGRQDKAFYQDLWSTLITEQHWEGEIWNKRKGKEEYPQSINISAVCGETGEVTGYVAIFSDISERKRHEEEIWHQANFDTLTGLANRSLQSDRLDRALTQARRNNTKVGLIFLDLDGFKWINDTLGHSVGDDLLIGVADRIRLCVREQDTVARLGGDEFTLVIEDLSDSEDMAVIAENIVTMLREPFILAERNHQISGSVGVTVFPDDGTDVQTLLKNADIAMYQAKQAGKNRFQFYAPQMHIDAQDRMQLEADLREAIVQNDFVLRYQPVIDTKTGNLVGAEALIRWEHAIKGTIPPIDFIPVAEDCGLIIPIGEWVLREAVRQWYVWQTRGYPLLRLSVNVSGAQFRESNLNKLVMELLAEYKIDPSNLVLEITESVLMESSIDSETHMREIKEQGVSFALDDFGTGFSSLSYLKRFPVDIVKVDQSFVRDCPEDRNDVLLVQAIVNMAHSLKLSVTAEGVETEAQRELLRDLGCDYLQGFLIGYPMPPEDFELLIQQSLQSSESA